MTRTRSRILVAAVVVVLAALGIALVAGTRGSGKPSISHETAAVTVSGTKLAEQPSSGTDPAIGATAPVVTGTDFAGKAVTIGAPGTPQLLVFAAHWCPHCQRELPNLVTWTTNGALKSATTLTLVSTGVNAQRDNYPPFAWLSRIRWTGPTLVDSADGAALQAYGLTGFPYFVALDRTGKVVGRTSGELELAQVQSLLAKAAAG